MTSPREIKPPEVEKLQRAFLALRPLIKGGISRAPKQTFQLGNLEAAFQELRAGLSFARESGGLINPWSIAGLKRDEVRNAAALAGLWLPEFGGNVSKRFLAEILSSALAGPDWSQELAKGYRVETECSPIGDIADRVDLVIESRDHLVGIEVKIDAMLGHAQLERYIKSLARRAALTGRNSHVVLLAPFPSPNSLAPSISWRDVATAARAATPSARSNRSFVEEFIASFGDHVSRF